MPTDAFKWLAGQACPFECSQDRDVDKFLCCMCWMGVIAFFVGIHYVVTLKVTLPGMAEFPIPEIMGAHVVFGALCASSALVLDPNKNTGGGARAAGTIMMVITLGYIGMMAYFLKNLLAVLVISKYRFLLTAKVTHLPLVNEIAPASVVTKRW